MVRRGAKEDHEMVSAKWTGTELTSTYVEAELRRIHEEGGDGDRLAERLREWFGEETLAGGPDPKVEETTVVWALAVDGAAARDVTVRVLADDGSFKLP